MTDHQHGLVHSVMQHSPERHAWHLDHAVQLTGSCEPCVCWSLSRRQQPICLCMQVCTLDRSHFEDAGAAEFDVRGQRYLQVSSQPLEDSLVLPFEEAEVLMTALPMLCALCSLVNCDRAGSQEVSPPSFPILSGSCGLGRDSSASIPCCTSSGLHQVQACSPWYCISHALPHSHGNTNFDFVFVFLHNKKPSDIRHA